MLMSWVMLVLVLVLAWLYQKWRYSYWSSKGVPTPSTLPFIGHLHKLMSLRTYRWIALNKIYHECESSPFVGLYEGLSPVLMVRDPDTLKNILVKDFDHFVDRRQFGPDQPDSYVSDMLGNKSGQEWKDLRAILSPTFSSGKMRNMFPIVCNVSDAFVASCLQSAENNSSVNMKDKAGRFTMDTIASCAFGIECNSFTKEKPIFVQKAETFFSAPPLVFMKMMVMITFPRLYNAVGFKVDREETDFFRSVVEETIKTRQHGQQRGDFLDLMLEARDQNTDSTSAHKHVLSNKVMVAQCILFLIAGYDTTASNLAFTSHLLAKYPEHQQRLRRELQKIVQDEGELTYQGVMEAKFLDACVNESLRMYPPALFVERKCSKDYSIPGTKVNLKKDDIVIVPVWSLHHDPQYWQDPEEFRPDRFLPENKANIKSFTHIPFGMGPRNCLAMRFALMESKVALAKLVLAADLKIPPGHEEVVLENSPFLIRPKTGPYVSLSPRKQE